MTQQPSTRPVVLITGGSSGIGAEFARAYATRRQHVVLVARREERMAQLAADLRLRHQTTVEYIVADLSQPDATRRVYDTVAGRGYQVETLINNAGFGTMDRAFADVPLERSLAMVQVNVAALVALTGLYLPEMLGRGRGAIINVASVAGFQPVSSLALYAASKSFVLNFSLAIWAETRHQGVRVLALCPGDTATEWGAVARSESPAAHPPQHGLTTQAVVRAALKALARNEGYVVVAPPSQRLFRWATKFAPRRAVARATARFLGQRA